MKIALIISGYLRSFKNNIESLKENLLNLYDVDIYVHITTSNENSINYNLCDFLHENRIVINVHRTTIQMTNNQDLFIVILMYDHKFQEFRFYGSEFDLENFFRQINIKFFSFEEFKNKFFQPPQNDNEINFRYHQYMTEYYALKNLFTNELYEELLEIIEELNND